MPSTSGRKTGTKTSTSTKTTTTPKRKTSTRTPKKTTSSTTTRKTTKKTTGTTTTSTDRIGTLEEKVDKLLSILDTEFRSELRQGPRSVSNKLRNAGLIK